MKMLYLACCLVFILSLSLAARSAQAAPGEVTRMRFGDCSILAVGDAEGASDAALLTRLSPEQRTALASSGKVKSQVTVFVILMPDRTVLVDTGWGDKGKALGALAAAGITPDKVDLVLLTHMHGDHISGAVRNGEPIYPKAELWVAEEEAAYWTSNEIMLAQPKDRQGAFMLPRAVLQAYDLRVRAFAPNQRIVPGISTVALPGHTPGHSGFLLESQGNRLLFWGDTMHFAEVQFAVPTAAVTYDVDQDRAVETRVALLKKLLAERIPFAGAHLPYPGVGAVAEKNGVLIYEPGLK